MGENRSYSLSEAERSVPPFAEKWTSVGPGHPEWKSRFQLEVMLLKKYLDFLKSKGTPPWFYLAPEDPAKNKGMQWRGYMLLPSKSKPRIDMIIRLPKKYPMEMPMAYVEDSLIDLGAGHKVYHKIRYPDDPTGQLKEESSGRSFVLICHDHMHQTDNAWAPNLGIAHFFIREVKYWFSAMQNVILRELMKREAGT